MEIYTIHIYDDEEDVNVHTNYQNIFFTKRKDLVVFMKNDPYLSMIYTINDSIGDSYHLKIIIQTLVSSGDLDV